MKTILKLLAVLLMLPVLAVVVIYSYGWYVTKDIKQREVEFDQAQEAASTSGNGFGGEAGLIVIDSGYPSEKFFWIDDKHLVFVKDRVAGDPKDVHRNYVWNVERNEIQMLEVDGEVRCWRDGYIHYTKFYNDGLSAGGRDRWDRYRATLKEVDDRWVVDDVSDIASLWPVPSDRHELYITDRCEPWFMIKHEKRDADDLPRHRFEYLYEWGWLLRLPVIGRVDSEELERIVGFYDLGGEIYSGQLGTRVMGLKKLPFESMSRLEINYLAHLDKYVIAATVLNSSQTPWLALLTRDGLLEEIKWDSEWKRFIYTPLISKLGLVWSGSDYRLKKPKLGDGGSFIRNFRGGVSKYLHGDGYFHTLSSDGCRLAQTNKPKANKGWNSLIVFDICNSRTRIEQ